MHDFDDLDLNMSDEQLEALDLDGLSYDLSLKEFVRRAWQELEPGTPMVDGWVLDAVCCHLEAVTRGEIDRLIINIPPGCSKAARLDEPVMTPLGWKAHGDIVPGDLVYGADGSLKMVKGVTPRFVVPEWRVTFDDGTSVVTSEAHEWTVERDHNATPRNRVTQVVETKDLLIKDGNQRPDAIKLAGPVELPEQHGQLVDPYLLGAWLGDGNKTDAMVTSHRDDAYVLATEHGAETSRTDGNAVRLRIPGLRVRLRVMGLIGNKHIPDAYLYGSIRQRWELLRGLMDTDGSADKSGRCMFAQSNLQLAENVHELISSLGLKAKLSHHISRLNGKSFDSWRVTFTPRAGDVVFKLRRKQERLEARKKDNPRTRHRYVVKVEKLKTEAIMSCLQVEGEHYLIGKSFVPTHNSMISNVFWPAWEWRERPWLRYISASYGQDLAVRDLVRCRDLVQSDWYQQRWPIQFKGDQNLKTAYVNMSTGFRFASSVGGSLTGWRGDRIILDDPHSVKTAESEAHRLESLRWVTETVPTRLNESKLVPSAIVCIMQRLHHEDVSGLLSDTGGWEHLILPMEWEGENRSKTCVHWTSPILGIHEPEPFQDPRGYSPSRIPDVEGQTREDVEELLWPERFSRESVEQLKTSFRQMGDDYAVAGQLQQRPAPRGGGIFDIESINYIDLDQVPEGHDECRGWDFAATSRKKNKRAAYTAGAHLRLVDGKLYVIDVVREQLDPSEVEQLLVETAFRDGRNVPISIPQDPGQAGKHQVRYFAGQLQGYNMHFSPESGDKEARANPFATQVRAGNVYFVKAEWNKDLIVEMSHFPKGVYKDQCDALSRAYSYIVTMCEPEIDVVGGIEIS
jgi:predicted phage terminase large subunit-like protein